jgi:hypothetical protein
MIVTGIFTLLGQIAELFRTCFLHLKEDQFQKE